jgi:hypothetical protein
VKLTATFPAEQAIVLRMRQHSFDASRRRGADPSVATVAAPLNAEGHRNRAGREWARLCPIVCPPMVTRGGTSCAA